MTEQASAIKLPAQAADSGGGVAIAPQNFLEVLKFSEYMAKSSFVPPHLRGKPENCMAVCLQALRWNLDPFMVGQKTYFVREGAPPGYEAQLIVAVVHARGNLDGRLRTEWKGQGQNLECTVTGKFRGADGEHAKTCRLKDIQTRNSPLWATDPEQQLAYYTQRAWARLHCPDVIMGVYTRDEVMAGEHVGPEQAKDVTPEAAAPPSKLDQFEDAVSAAEPVDAERVDPETGEAIDTAQPAIRILVDGNEYTFATIEDWQTKMAMRIAKIGGDAERLRQFRVENGPVMAELAQVWEDAVRKVDAAFDELLAPEPEPEPETVGDLLDQHEQAE